MSQDAKHFTTDGHYAACGRNKHHRASGVTGLRLSSRAYPVDCALCQRTKAYKAAKAAEEAAAPPKPVVPTFAEGDKVRGYGSTAVVLNSNNWNGEVEVRWDHDGRRGSFDAATQGKSFEKVA